MNPKLFRYVLPIVLLVDFTSCKKIIEQGPGDNTCSDCTALYSTEKEIKTIEVKDTDVVTNRYFLFYANGLLDSIAHEKIGGKTLTYDYSIKVYYSKNSCIPSGYTYLTGDDYNYPPVDASFLVDSNRIMRKSIYRPVAASYSGDSSSSFRYSYNADGTISSNDYHYKGDQTPEIFVYTTYNAQKNLVASNTLGDFIFSIDLSQFDTKPNPFSFQDNILYFLSIHPYNVFPSRYDLMGTTSYSQYFPFDYVAVSKNNLGFLRFDNDYVYYDEYTFKYVYNADGYPSNITIFSNIRHNEDVDNYKKAEEINLTYY